ncbi:MAG: hypothetical protein H0X62_00705 [Bacteroidetes bacterium]|nr:hypothetical protein [Bacteroidota bacterium]
MNIIKLSIIGIVLLLSGALRAQVQVNVGTPPQWGPAGYSGVRYYYLPDVEAYYDVHSSMFIYPSSGKWVRNAHLPKRYRSYDLYSGYKVVMSDYNGKTPYANHKSYKVKYHKGYKGGAQSTIGSKPGNGNSNLKSKSKSPSNKPQAKSSNHKSAGPGNVKGESPKGQKKQNHGGGGGKGKKK